MGSFYVNITLRVPDRERVVSALLQGGRTACVSPVTGGFVVVYDQACETQDVRIIEQLAGDLSGSLSCPALAVLNHDDDILWYQLFDGGRLVDQYDSSPGYFDGSDADLPAGGDARQLCELMGAGDPARVAEILSLPWSDDGPYLFAIDRHKDLVQALGLPEMAVGYGYDYVLQEAPYEGIDLSQFIFVEEGRIVDVGELSEVETAGRAAIEPAPAAQVARMWEIQAQKKRDAAEQAIQAAEAHLHTMGRPFAADGAREAWPLTKDGTAMWMVVLRPAPPAGGGVAVYVEAGTGRVVRVRAFPRGE